MGNLRTPYIVFACAAAVAGMACEEPSLEVRGSEPGAFVAVGVDGAIVSSLDGSSWAIESSGVSVDLSSIAAGRGTFVAVGQDGTIVTSGDGTSWTKQLSQTDVDLWHVIFNGEKFIAVGGDWESGGVALTSSDGATWTGVESPSNYMFNSVAYGSGTLVASGQVRSDHSSPALFTSVVSPTSSAVGGWTQRQGPHFYDSLTTTEGRIMVVGDWSVGTSTDGVAWTQMTYPASRGGRGIASSGASFVIVGEFGTVYRSLDGTEWTEHSTGGRDGLSGVAFGDAHFVAVGSNGAIVSSLDGSTWSTEVAGTTRHLQDVTYGAITP